MADEAAIVQHETKSAPNNISTTDVPPGVAAAAVFQPFPGMRSVLSDSSLGRRGNLAARQAMVLQLQQSVGNAAVRQFLQRDGPPAPTAGTPSSAPTTGALDASMVHVSGGETVLSGNVTAEPEGTGFARIKGPSATMKPVTVDVQASAALAPGEIIQAGLVQTLMGSERVGVYLPDRAPPGAAPIEDHFTLGQSRDGGRGHYAPGEPTFQRAEAPWFLPPAIMSSVHMSETLNLNEGFADLFDQPSWLAPLTVGQGKLTETRGQDSFITSIGVKRGTLLIHFHSTQWSILWAVKNIDAAHKGTGATGTSAPSKIDPPKVDGKIASYQPGQHWITFPTLADAMGANVTTLLQNAVEAKGNDVTSYSNTIEALRTKNPLFNIRFTMVTTHGNIGRDHIFLQATGSKAIPRQDVKLNNGEHADITFRLNEVLDPGEIVAGTRVKLSIELDPVTGTNLITEPSWSYPFSSLAQGGVLGDGKYKLTGGYI